MATIQFKGKPAVWNHHLSVPYHTLEKNVKQSLKGKNEDENLIIEGDNLLALKALLPQYQGKVKCIYIDPPYNTGNEGWVYNDNVNSPTTHDWMGKVVGKEGEDLTRHDKWLCMMTPRLKLLRELLAEDGVLVASIDDNEMHRLRSLLDDVFGEANFIADFVWNSTKSITNPALVSVSHTYNFVYAKNYQTVSDKRSEYKLPAIVSGFENPDSDLRGPWKADPFEAGGERPNQMYPIKNPITGEIFLPRKGNCWKNDKKKFEELLKGNRIVFGKKGDGRPLRKRFLWEAEERGLTPNTWWDEVGTTTNGTNELKELFGEKVFDNPKPTSLIKKFIHIFTDEDAIILDSFAGSGTTAQAVLDLNKEDGGNRKFILVEMEGYANKITAERVRRASKKFEYDAGFTYYALGPAIDAETLLEGKKLPTFKEFAKYVYYLATGKNHPDEAKINEKTSLVGKGDSATIYLLYTQDREALKKLAITLDWAQKTHEKDSGKKIVYAPACYLDDEALDQYGIKFVSIPYNLFERSA